MKPDIVFFGEPLPEEYFAALTEDLEKVKETQNAPKSRERRNTPKHGIRRRGPSSSPCITLAQHLEKVGYLAPNPPPPLGPYRRPMPRVLGGS